MSSSVKAPMSGLEKLEIEIRGEKFVSKILISGIDYPGLKSIKLHAMENLMEVNLTSVKTLNFLDIKNCKKLERFTGASDLTNLVLLNISECPELKQLSVGHLRSLSGISNFVKLVESIISGCGKLEFEYLRLRGMNCLKSIKIDESVKVKYIELEGCQILETLKFGCEELVELIIRGCRRLKVLSSFIGASCLERIIIDGCKIWELEINGCQNLRSVSGNSGLTTLVVSECPELEELPSVAKVTHKIVIESCEKLQNVSGIEEMHPPMFMRLCYCSNAVIRSCIHKLKSVPSEGMEMIGRAADGAESSLNENLFCDAHIAVDAVTDINPMERSCLCCLSSLIGCFLVVVDSSTSVMDINNSLPAFIVESDFPMQVREGEWIIMIGVMNKFWYGWSNEYVEKISGVLRRKGIMKKGFWIKVKGGEEWKILGVLRIIVDKLYHL